MDRRAADFVLRRQGRDELPLVLHARRLYILPTRAGAGFGVLLLAMFIAGLNYQNSLALFLTFLFAAFGVIALLDTHRRLAGLRVVRIDATPAFAGDAVECRVVLDTHAVADAPELRVAASDPPGAALPAAIGPDAMAVILLRCPALRRGRWRLRRLRLETRAPFGLFQAWTWLHTDTGTCVYPRAAGTLDPPAAPGDGQGMDGTGAGFDEWSGLRPFREGDSPRQVAWKAYAREAPMLIREYHGQVAPRRHFDHTVLAQLAPEARLEQLCRWCVDAAARGESWSLRLLSREIGPATGPRHLEACLTALAEFPGAGSGA
jgi:uncharacterized protein (DUF58 family)